jgi:hypothetical protein
MPTGISQTVINPATLTQRSTPESGQQKSREPVAASTENLQSVLATPGDELVRAPEPETGAQAAQNQLPAASTGAVGSSGSEPAGNPAVSQPPTDPRGLQDLGIGGNFDLVG